MSAAVQLDFATVARLALAQADTLLCAWFPAGRKRGHEFVVGNLTGDAGESLSINLSTGAWGDFAGSERGGDLISLYAAIHRIGQGDAQRRLADELGAPVMRSGGASAKVIPMPSRDDPADAEWSIVLPAPTDAPPPPDSHSRHGAPVHVARYESGDGELLYLVYRFEPDGQRKQFSGVTYWRHVSGRGEWRFKSPPSPRPLFGLPALAALPDKPVLIVEGERKCMAAQRALGTAYACVTWSNGASSAGRADWSALTGRNAVIWPDADAPGQQAAIAVCVQVRQAGGQVRIVQPPEGAPDGWDVGDAITQDGWDAARIGAHLSAPTDDEPDVQPDRSADQAMFVPLGHDRGRFFFAGTGGQVRDFAARDLHNMPALCELAPPTYWEREYPAKTGANTMQAGAALMQACYAIGVYDPARLRGRGAWIDNGRSVLHLGDRLFVNGQEHGLRLPASYHIYENAQHLPLPAAAPLPAEQAKRLLDLCMMPSWEAPAHMGRLLAGWCVVAPVCGAMPWRPHLWITGEKASGKSWVMNEVVSPIVGSIALHVQSVTTEAGIRQVLSSDARPVFFDEAETQTEGDRARMQNVLNLARQASSEGGAAIVKGTTSGRAQHFFIRSMFAFSSINYGVTQAADESRVVALNLRADTEPGGQARFDAMRKMRAEIITPEFAAGLLARTMTLLPTIRANAAVFADAIARAGHGRRTGDTVGVLLAGAWSLRSSRRVTIEQADAFVHDSLWLQEAITKADVLPEWQRALGLLLQHRVRITRGNGPTDDVPIAELLLTQVGRGDAGAPGPDLAGKELARFGLRVMESGVPHLRAPVVLLSNTSDAIAAVFAKSPWAAAWLSTLSRAPGAKPSPQTVRFGAIKTRALAIPLNEVLPDDE